MTAGARKRGFRHSQSKSSRTVTLSDLRLIDMSEDGTVIGIEFISASDGVDLSDVPFAPTVGQAIGDSGLPIKLFA